MADELVVGQRVFITDQNHPWVGHVGTVIGLTHTYGLGWTGQQVELDGNCGRTYVQANQVMSGKPRVDSMRLTYKRRK